MGRSKMGKNLKWPGMLLGFMLGAVLTAVVGLYALESLTGKNVSGRMHYIVDKGKEFIVSFSRSKMSKGKKKNTDQGQNGGKLYLEIHADRVIRPINPMIYGSNLSSKAEFEMDVAKFAKELGITNLRFTGGNSFGYRWFKSEYDFEDRFDRAPLANMENVVKFCKIAGAEIVVQVNVESGTAQEAAQWVEYMNKGAGSRVNYWELG